MEHIFCSSSISFDDNALLAWNILVIGCDYHEIENVELEKISPVIKPIAVGDNVWLETEVLY